MHLHEKGYNFLPQLLKDEFSSLKTALNAASKAERTCSRADKASWAAEKERLERQLAQTRTRLERTQREAREREVLANAKKAEREKRKEGKGAWHMKKGRSCSVERSDIQALNGTCCCNRSSTRWRQVVERTR